MTTDPEKYQLLPELGQRRDQSTMPKICSAPDINARRAGR
jgi:hypothetical protein